MTPEEFIEYTSAAKYRAIHKINQRISNDSPEHAKILIDAMISTADKMDDIKIYSGNLPEDTYKDSFNSAKCEKIEILVDSESDISWLKTLDEKVKEHIHVFKIAEKRKNHFLCVSSGAFRYEKDGESARAEANFNEPEIVAKISVAFNRYMDGAERLEI